MANSDNVFSSTYGLDALPINPDSVNTLNQDTQGTGITSSSEIPIMDLLVNTPEKYKDFNKLLSSTLSHIPEILRNPRPLFKDNKTPAKPQENASKNLSDIQANIYETCINEGLTHALAVGILGNIALESGFNINAKGDSGKSHGLFLMGKGEREQFASWKKANISRISDLPDYLALVVYVCDMMKSNKYNARGMDKKLAYAYWNSSDPAKTALAFCAIYEKAGKPMMDNRIKYANKFNLLFSNYNS